MTQESTVSTSGKESTNTDNAKQKERRDKNVPPSKVVIRRLPPTMNIEIFTEQISPVPEHDYMYFVKADMSLAPHAFSRAYINFINQEDIFIFKDKFDGYVFVDQHGNEYPAVVEFAPFQKIPKKKVKKKDSKCGTIENDPDYLKFLESLQNPEEIPIPTAESYLEEIEARERELKSTNGIPRMTTPLIEYIKHKKAEKLRFREEKREERRRREIEKKRVRDEERKRRKAEKDRSIDKGKENDNDEFKKSESEKNKTEPILKLLRNPEREKDELHGKEKTNSLHETRGVTTREKPTRPMSEWEKEKRRREEERQRQRDKQRERERERRELREKERMNRRDENRGNISSKFHDKKGDDTGSMKSFRDQNSKMEDKDRYKKSDTRPKSGNYEHQWNKNRRWENDDRHKRGGKTGYDRPGRSDYNRKSQEEKITKIEKGRGATDEDSSLATSVVKVEKKEAKDNLEELDDSKADEIHQMIQEENEEADEKLDDRKGNDDSKDNGGRQDPRTERRIKNKDRPSLELYRPGMRRLQRNSPQKETQIGSASSSSSPSPTPQLIAKSFLSGQEVVQENIQEDEVKKDPEMVIEDSKNEDSLDQINIS